MFRLGARRMFLSLLALDVRAYSMYGTALVFGGASVFQSMKYLDDKLNLNEQLKEVNGEIKEVKGEMKELKGEMKELKGEIKELRGEMKGIKDDLKTLFDAIQSISVLMK